MTLLREIMIFLLGTIAGMLALGGALFVARVIKTPYEIEDEGRGW